MKKILASIAVAALVLSVSSCRVTVTENTDYSDAEMWCCFPDEASAPVDVFYIVSTVTMKSVNPDGTESFNALLTDSEKADMAEEINHVHEGIFPDSLNFFAPYYHQMTMSSYTQLSKEELAPLADIAKQEICDAFDYFMDNCNDGRPFIIAGYSQGSIMVKTLLQHMTDEQYSRMVAAYMMGFGLDEQTLEHPHVKAAEGAFDTGVTVSWNSMKNVEAIYPGIWSNAVTCINPANWRTDDTPASFEFDGETLTAHVDQDKHVVLVEGFNAANHDLPSWDINPWSDDNYHNYEIYLYNPIVRQNVLDRIANFK